MPHSIPLACHLIVAISLSATARPATFETDNFRLAIRPDGTVHSLLSKTTGKEYFSPGEHVPFARVSRGGTLQPSGEGKRADITHRWIYRDGESFEASSATFQGNELAVQFADTSVTATFRVTSKPDYLAFELLELTGTPVDRIEWLCLNLAELPHRGAWVNFAFNQQFGICLCAGNVRTNVEMDETGESVSLRAVAESNPGLPGTVAVLFGCPDPRERFLEVMSVVERDFDLPAGATNRRRSEQRLSYLWATRPTPKNIGQFVELAKRAGLRMILFSYTDFAKTAGHFPWKESYPGGMADLKNVTGTIRNAGLKVGLHIHYSKAHKSDPYVSPVPDERLHQLRLFTLAQSVDLKADVLPVEEDPTGCTLDDKRRIVKLGAELVAYEGFRTEPTFAFTGCQRGHLGTAASPHAKGERVGLLNVDTWPIFVRFDQTTDIQDEVGRRIGDIYRQTGPYEMVYFDGAEDVQPPFWHHVASAQQRVFRCLDPPPPVCESALYSHYSWHMITRSNAYDIVAPAAGMKDFCRLMPCPTAAERVNDFSRIEFGWLGHFGGGPNAAAGPDVWEYVVSRAAAWDCPISLKLSLPEIRTNPRWEDCLDVIRIWEDARLDNHFSDSQRQSLRNVCEEDAHYVPCFDQRGIWENIRTNQGLTPIQRRILANRQEHHLFIDERGKHELVPITEIPLAHAPIKAYWFRRASHPRHVYVLLWAVDEDASLRLPRTGNPLHLMRPFGTELPLEKTGNETVVTVADRSYLVFADVGAKEVTHIVSEAISNTTK